LFVVAEFPIANAFERFAHSPGLLKYLALLVANLLQPRQLLLQPTFVASQFGIALQAKAKFRRRSARAKFSALALAQALLPRLRL
jgi:hypothetical protein